MPPSARSVWIDDEGNRCTTRRQKARALYNAAETLRLQDEEEDGDDELEVEVDSDATSDGGDEPRTPDIGNADPDEMGDREATPRRNR